MKFADDESRAAAADSPIPLIRPRRQEIYAPSKNQVRT